MTLLCLAVIIAAALAVHAKEKNQDKNNNNNGQPPQIQPENGNNSRVQALEAEDVRLQQLISDLGPSGGPKGDARATGHYWSRA